MVPGIDRNGIRRNAIILIKYGTLGMFFFFFLFLNTLLTKYLHYRLLTTTQRLPHHLRGDVTAVSDTIELQGDRLEKRQGEGMGLETWLVSSPWYLFFIFFLGHTNTFYLHLEVRLRDPNNGVTVVWVLGLEMHPHLKPRYPYHTPHHQLTIPPPSTPAPYSPHLCDSNAHNFILNGAIFIELWVIIVETWSSR